MERYRLLHQKDAGRATRSKRSFDLMHEWIRSRHGALCEARREGGAVAFMLLVLYETGAFYGSACRDPDSEVTAPHLLQWKSILWLKKQGFDYYDLGLQTFGPQWFDIPSEKEIGISKYKRGFGGVTVPLHVAEYFYSKDVRDQWLGQRFGRLRSP